MQDAVLCLQRQEALPRAWSCREGVRRCAGVLVWLVLTLVSSLPSWADPAPVLRPATETDALLQATGVFDQLASVSVMVEQELANLEASPLFSLEEITQVRRLMSRLREDVLYQQLQTALARELPAGTEPALLALSQAPEWRSLVQEEQALQAPAQQEQLRLYQLRTRETPPAASRLAWMQAMDDARYRTRFEVALRVALRKNLLAAVALVKTRHALTETELDNELRDFRAKLSDELAQKALASYLFLYRKTPTERVQATVAVFQDPRYRHFMEVCEAALQHSFLAARAESEERLRVVQNNTP